MAGTNCPKCQKNTFFTHGNKMNCSNCGYSITKPSNNGMGGKGKKCPACGKYTWFNDHCNSCGAHE